MKQLLQLYLTYLTVNLPNTQVKTCFCVLWFNCELKIENENKKHKTKCPTDSRLWLNISKQNTVYFFCSKREKTYVITLEVYNVKTLELYNTKH